MLPVCPKGNPRRSAVGDVFSVGFPFVSRFNTHLLISSDLEWKHKNILLRWSVFLHNLLLGLSALKSTQARKSHTQTHKVTLMLSAACWHMAASHTKTEALEFSISIPKPWRLPFFSLAHCWGAADLNAGQSFSCTQRWQKHQTSGLDARTDGANGEKHRVPDFIKRSANHLKGCWHTRSIVEGSSNLCLQINNSSHCCHAIFKLSFPFYVTQSLTREKGGLFFSLWQAHKEQQKYIIYIIITHTGWGLKRYPAPAPKHQWLIRRFFFSTPRCTGLCTHAVSLSINQTNNKILISFVADDINSPPSLSSAVNRFFWGLYSQMETPQICPPILHFPPLFFFLLQAPPPLQSVYLFSPTSLPLCQSL